jgi:O-antigen/teichoic acid export membrane protein
MIAILKVFFSDVLSKAILAILGIALIRYMPQTEYAVYTFAFAVVTLTSQVVAGSFNRIYIVGFERLDLGETSTPILTLQLAVGIGIILVGLPWAGQFHGVYWYVAALIIATCLFDFSKTVAQRELAFSRFSLIEVIRSVITAMGLFAALYLLGFDLQAWHVLSVQTLAMVLVFLVFTGGHLDLRGLTRIGESFRIAAKLTRGEYRYLFAYFLLLALFMQIDVFMLRLMSDDLQLATYGAAFRYYSALAMALGAVHAVLLPLIQRVKTYEELQAIYDRHKKIALFFIPLVILAAWGSQWLMPWVDLGRYPDSVMVFRILCVSVVVSFVFSPHVNLIMRFEQFRFLSVLIVVALFINVILNSVLIPFFGAIGVAIATLIASASVTVPIYIKSRKMTFGFRKGEIPAGESI